MIFTKVILSDEDKNKSMSYAQAVMGTIDYRNRGQGNFKKIVQDHYVGKLGEIAVCKLLQSLGKTVTQPDFDIHTKKSWDDDLFVDGEGVAVKTQNHESAKRYGLSWTFHVNDPILEDPNKLVYFVEYTPEEMHVYNGYKISELKFKPPVLERLVPYKKVVYAQDLSN